MTARALGLVLDTLEALAEGTMRPQSAALLESLWTRVYGGEKDIDDALVATLEGDMLAPAASVRATGRGGQYPVMVSTPHWRLQCSPWSGRARLVVNASFLAQVAGEDVRIEAERVASWLYGEGIAWEVSRLDVCTDVQGIEVEPFADLDTCVTRSHGVRVNFDDGEVEHGAADVVAPRIATRFREVQTVTFGSAASRVQTCIYDKRAEARASGKTWQIDAARERGWDGESSLTRVEFRFRGRALDEFPELRLRGLDVLERTDEWMPRLWRYATTRAVRYVVPDDADSNRSRWLEPTAEWTVVAALADAAAPVVRVRGVTESLREERVRRASRDEMRGAVTLCAEHDVTVSSTRAMLTRIVDGESESEPELVVLANAFAVIGADMVGIRTVGVRDRAERALEWRSRLERLARKRGWVDEPSLSLYRAA